MKLKTVSINEKEQIFLDGEAIENVAAYKLENSADSNEPAKLTVTMYVTVDRTCSESQALFPSQKTAPEEAKKFDGTWKLNGEQTFS